MSYTGYGRVDSSCCGLSYHKGFPGSGELLLPRAWRIGGRDSAEMTGPCLDALTALEGMIREGLPASAPVPAIYLPLSYRAERRLAAALVRLLAYLAIG